MRWCVVVVVPLQIKLKQDCSAMWTEVHELAALLKSGKYTW